MMSRKHGRGATSALTGTAVAFALGLATGLVGCPRQALVLDAQWVHDNAGPGPLGTALEQAVEAHGEGDFEEAIALLSQAREMDPEPAVLAFIELREGMARLRLHEPAQALAPLSAAAARGVEDVSTPARLLSALSLHELGKTAEARKALAGVTPDELASACTDAVLVHRLLVAAGELALSRGDFNGAAVLFAWATRDLGSGEQDVALARDLLERLDAAVASSASQGVPPPSPSLLLEDVPPRGPVWALLARRAALAAIERWDIEGAEVLAAQLEQAGFGMLSGPVRAALETAREELASTDASTIGALLPLSGKHAGVGALMKEGIETALAILATEHEFEVVYVDTASDPDVAREKVRELRFEHHAIAAVGPAAADTSASAAEEAQAVGLPLVTLSPAPGLTGGGEWILRNFSTLEVEAQALARWAVEDAGMHHLAVLHPDNGYGRSMAELFTQAATLAGAQVDVSASFAPAEKNFVELADRVAQAPEVQGVFLPATSQQLSLIAPALAYKDVWPAPPAQQQDDDRRTVVLLAPQVAYSPDLPVKAGKFLEGTVFAMGFVPGSPEPFASFFQKEFERDHPGRLTAYHTYAADALFVVGQAIVLGEVRLRGELLERLLDPAACGPDIATVGAFAGFASSGEPLDPLALVTLDGGAFVAVEAKAGQ